MLFYLIMVGPALLLSVWASFKVQSTFKKYSKIRSSSGYTGAQAAEIMLKRNGVSNVTIELIPGSLSDHYDPQTKTLRLSESVYSSNSLSAVGVACHEAGHALQDAQNYAFLGMRSSLVPLVGFGTKLSYVFIIGGFLFHIKALMFMAVAVFFLAMLFSIVTLPVEWNASARAKVAMVNANLVTPEESEHAGKVLNAAFLTYLAAAMAAIMNFLYYLMLSRD